MIHPRSRGRWCCGRTRSVMKPSQRSAGWCCQSFKDKGWASMLCVSCWKQRAMMAAGGWYTLSRQSRMRRPTAYAGRSASGWLGRRMSPLLVRSSGPTTGSLIWRLILSSGISHLDPPLAKYAQTVGHCRSPGMESSARPFGSASVGSRCGQPWWSAGSARSPVWCQDTVDSDLPLRRSFRGHLSTAAFLVRAGVLGLWLQLNVPSFRLVRARGGHGHTPVAGDPLLAIRPQGRGQWLT